MRQPRRGLALHGCNARERIVFLQVNATWWGESHKKYLPITAALVHIA